MDDRLMKTMLDMDEHHWWYRGRRRIIAVELDRLPLPPGAKVLDAGCGSGRTLPELERFGSVCGIELDPTAAALAAARGAFDVRTGRLEELPWEDATFDLITCLDVIEHTPDDRVTLRELLRVTRPGGWLLVTVPAYQALWSQHDVENHHFRRYEREPLRRAAAEAGWAVRRMTSFNSLLLAPAAAVRLAQRRRPRRHANGDYKADLNVGPAWLNGVLEQPLRSEARWLARGRTLPAGLSLLAVLQRPA
ncbi:MAG: class I SAM-dependent methyltransferase [Solirubrobacteraceae bacterium]